MDHVAFLPHLQESIMDELRTTEGMLFRDESAKKLFMDVKSLVIETLQGKDAEALDKLARWEDVADEEIARSTLYGDIADRLTSVTVLYAKYLYAKGNPDPINIKKPRVESLLRGMYSRMVKLPHVRNGTFFQLDPLRQDFVVRDIFRLTLANDCIVVIEKMPAVVVQEESEATREFQKEVEERDVYPDDSISAVMTRNEESAKTEVREPPIKEESVASAFSKASTRLTQSVMPKTVKRILLPLDEA
jgi:hypothetical protein